MVVVTRVMIDFDAVMIYGVGSTSVSTVVEVVVVNILQSTC